MRRHRVYTQISAGVLALLVALACLAPRGTVNILSPKGKLPASGEAALDAALAPFWLAEPVCAENLTVVPIVAPESADPGPEYLTLEEALKKKVVIVKELEGGGAVPKLEMESRAEKPVFIPFGAIVTGGQQDRMIKNNIALRPGEKKQVEVYCVEQGRWSTGALAAAFYTDETNQGGPGAPPTFASYGAAVDGTSFSVDRTEHYYNPPADTRRWSPPALADSQQTITDSQQADTRRAATPRRPKPLTFYESARYGSNALRFSAANAMDQNDIWQSVGKQNQALLNTSPSSNFQGNWNTRVFKEAEKKLAPVGETLALGGNAVGAVVIVNGEVASCEIFASRAYFRKLWPQIFSGAVIDAAAAPEKRATGPAKAARLSREYLQTLAAARKSRLGADGLVRVSVDGAGTLGGAVIEPGKGRLVYFRLFPKRKPAAGKK